MYRILTFYVYIGEYALSINISILRPKVTIPWREISDIEIETEKIKGAIIVYRSGGRTKNLFINKLNFEKKQWDAFINNCVEQWNDVIKSNKNQTKSH